ncbi:MAG: tetratricopeptide repeat protein [Sulfuricaulis sp.]
MKKAVAFLIFCLMAPGVMQAQDLASLEKMRQAAEQGNVDAQLEMGILYEFGYHMPKNDVNALAWYMRAADQGGALAAKRRDLLKAHMKPEEIDAAQKLYSELVSVKAQKTETAPAGDTKPQSTETVPPAATIPPAAGAETPPVPDAKSPDMEAPAGPVTDKPAAEPAKDKPSSPP